MDMPDKQSGLQSRPRTAVKDLVLTAMFSALIAVCSILSIPVGEVPITLQTFAVCFAAAMLGWKRGTLSVLVYILLGAVGLPVFSGMKDGVGVLAGPTGGYIIGFLLTAVLIGFVSEKTDRKALPMTAAMTAGVLLCYAVGTLWFMVVTHTGLGVALMMCVVPFLIFDAVKIAAAVLLSNRLTKVILL